MRGKGKFHCFVRGNDRITPACAGKRVKQYLSQAYGYRHPRTCGEKYRENTEAMRVQGSPPRMRGQVRAIVDAALEGGITPAHAGKRAAADFRLGTIRDHPRVCGEKIRKKRQANCTMGSPPHMRGKGLFAADTIADFRITPAYAGKSFRYFVVCRYLQDHPRVCGEKHLSTA